MLPVQLATQVKTQLDACVSHGPQDEFIGLLGGARATAWLRVECLIPLSNQAARTDCFAVDPLAFANAEHAIRQAGASWLGFVHSHPHGQVGLSTTDRAQLWRDCVQLIVARRALGELAVAGYWLTERGSQTLTLLPDHEARP